MYQGTESRVGRVLVPSLKPGGRKWVKPDGGFVKVNCDASFIKNGGSGNGFIGRDEASNFCFAASKSNEESIDVESAEAEAVL